MRRRIIFFGLLALALGLVGTGCGGKKPVKVVGVVTLDGQPVERATVLFTPVGGKGRPASALTDSEGVFRLTTIEPGDGAFPGEYKVVVKRTKGRVQWDSFIEGKTQADMYKMDPMVYKEMHNPKRKTKKQVDLSPLPSVYGQDSTTPLTCTVPTDGRVVLALSKGGS